MKPKSCYTCQHRSLCHKRHEINALFEAQNGAVEWFDFNAPAGDPKSWQRMYETMAEICKRYIFQEEK